MINSFNRKIGVTIFRIVIGILILKDFITFLLNRKFLFNNNAIMSYSAYLDIIKYYKLEWIYINFNIEKNAIILCFLGVFFSTTFIYGIFTRLSTVFLFFLLFVFKIRNIYLLDGADNVISVILPFFIFIDSFSMSNIYEQKIKNLKNKFSNYINITSNYFSIGMMLQICIIYLFASLHKLQGPIWLDGTALYYILNSEDFSATSLNTILTSSLIIVKFLTWFSIGFQITFPFLILFRKTKYLALLLGVLFHIGIFILMRIDNFSLVMLVV